MAEPINRESDKFMLRLPDGMREQIKGSASDNGRSMNAEIVHALTHWLRDKSLQEFLSGSRERDNLALIVSALTKNEAPRPQLEEQLQAVLSRLDKLESQSD